MLKPQPVPPVPEMTARAAHAAFPKGHCYLTLRDELGTIFTDDMFADLFPTVGRPAEAPWRLALVTIVQFAEGLSDRDVADAVRDRITLKYLLGLEYDDSGFDYSILSRFRDRLVEGNSVAILLDALVEASRKAGLIAAK
jgi:transposase